MKLSAAQEKILTQAKKEIDEARSYETFEDYFLNEYAPHMNGDYDTPEKYKTRDYNGYKYYEKYWTDLKNAIVLTHCNSRSLKKLESLGLIEIIEDSTNQNYGIDVVKILNY